MHYGANGYQSLAAQFVPSNALANAQLSGRSTEDPSARIIADMSPAASATRIPPSF